MVEAGLLKRLQRSWLRLQKVEAVCGIDGVVSISLVWLLELISIRGDVGRFMMFSNQLDQGVPSSINVGLYLISF